MKYATVLLEHCPEDATQLFIDYYTGNFRPKKDAIVLVQAIEPQSGMERAATAVQNLAAMLPLPYMNANSSQPPHQNRDVVAKIQVVEQESTEPPPKYDIPKPRTAFSAFVDHPFELITFLEAATAKDELKEEDGADMYTTLFEMYTHMANNTRDEERPVWENKAKALIESKKVPISTSNVLLLSHLENFRDGTTLVREKQGLRFDIFRSYTSAKDTTGAIKALHKYGLEEPELYPAALTYFTSSAKILAEAGDELDKVLDHIDAHGLMAPLQVVQTLSGNGVATMGLIKRYLGRTIERERQEISNVVGPSSPNIANLTAEPQSHQHLQGRHRHQACRRRPPRQQARDFQRNALLGLSVSARHASSTLPLQAQLPPALPQRPVEQRRVEHHGSRSIDAGPLRRNGTWARGRGVPNLRRVQRNRAGDQEAAGGACGDARPVCERPREAEGSIWDGERMVWARGDDDEQCVGLGVSHASARVFGAGRGACAPDIVSCPGGY
jgi:hypothetical protein